LFRSITLRSLQEKGPRNAYGFFPNNEISLKHATHSALPKIQTIFVATNTHDIWVLNSRFLKSVRVISVSLLS
jgi:hypothetical protein